MLTRWLVYRREGGSQVMISPPECRVTGGRPAVDSVYRVLADSGSPLVHSRLLGVTRRVSRSQPTSDEYTNAQSVPGVLGVTSDPSRLCFRRPGASRLPKSPVSSPASHQWTVTSSASTHRQTSPTAGRAPVTHPPPPSSAFPHMAHHSRESVVP